jgi:hypothetical protein
MPTWLSATNTDQVPIDVVDTPNNPTNYHPVDNPAFETQINPALNWLHNRQVLHVKGDWVYRKPHVRPGCWAFQFSNTYFIDLDNTSVVVMVMDHACQQFGIGGQRSHRLWQRLGYGLSK